MPIDSVSFRELLLQRLGELDEQDRISASDRDPVVLDQESVGRLPRIDAMQVQAMALAQERRRKAERAGIAAALLRSEEHTSEFQSLLRHSYAVFCLKKKTTNTITTYIKLLTPHTSQTYLTQT